MKPGLSLYLHIPFCIHRCAYCDFNTYAGQASLIPAYVEALIREINFIRQQLDRSGLGPSGSQIVKTIFFGGGTPSLLSGSQLAALMDALRAAFTFSSDLEATLEANPGTVSADFLHRIHEAGIHRLSFGVQSAHADELHMLERLHDFFEVIDSLKWARQAGFGNINLDLIYGLPGQTLARWQETLQRIVDLHPEHISAYALTLEHGTPFGRWSARGLLPVPDPDLAAEMYEFAEEFLAAKGYVHYEISNWAKTNSEFRIQNSEFMCRHNLQYWHSLPYLGLGAGAHGYANGIRYSNCLRIQTYIGRVNTENGSLKTDFPLTPAAVNHHRQTRRDEMGEFMLMGLRLVREGISSVEFESRFGARLDQVYGKQIEGLIRSGLVERQAEVLRLTRRGRLLGNRVFMEFVG